MGPGPPPQRARRANTASTRGITTRGTQSSAMSKAGSSLDVARAGDMRLSDDTLEDETWNHRRYQREDEDLWGHDDSLIPLQRNTSGSSVAVAGFPLRRPGTSLSGNYSSGRAPPVNELHPPVVSLPSPDPADNRWMLQPPPKASVMAGKERASNRSRSGSGASSRVELSLQRQLSTKQVQQRLERGETPELPSMSPMSSYTNLVSGQRHDRGRTPQARPPSSSSSRKKKRDTALERTDTAMTRTDTTSTQNSSVGSSEPMVRGSSVPLPTPVPDIEIMRVRQSRPHLSTIVSSDSGDKDLLLSPIHAYDRRTSSDENSLPERPSPVHDRFTSTQSSESTPYLMKHRSPLSSSDISSLNVLQDFVSPRALLNSRFVSAPLVEAKIRLPPSAEDLRREQETWNGSRLCISRGSGGTDRAGEQIRVPFDKPGPPERDPRLRWSVDF